MCLYIISKLKYILLKINIELGRKNWERKWKQKTHQREICPLKGCSLVLREEKDKVRLLAAASRGHRTAVSQTTCNREEKTLIYCRFNGNIQWKYFKLIYRQNICIWLLICLNSLYKLLVILISLHYQRFKTIRLSLYSYNSIKLFIYAINYQSAYKSRKKATKLFLLYHW